MDVRSDLFSFGIVLYEMVTGRVPFSGARKVEALGAILHRQAVPPTDLNPEVSTELERIVAKCLEKDPADRYQDGRDLVVDLRRLIRETESQAGHPVEGGEAARRMPTLSRWAIASSVLFVLAAGLIFAASRLGWFAFVRGEPRQQPRMRQLTSNPRENPLTAAAISPDGRLLAYADQDGIKLRVIDGGETYPLALPQGFSASDVDWFPDGTKLLAVRARDPGVEKKSLWTVSILGGTPRMLRDDVMKASVSPDGSLIAFLPYVRSEIWIMRAGGEEAHRVVGVGEHPDASHPGALKSSIVRSVTWSPDGQKIAYVKWIDKSTGFECAIEIQDLQSSRTGVVLSDQRLSSDIEWLPDGRLIYDWREPDASSDGSDLWEIRIDPNTGEVASRPRRLIDWSGFIITDLSATQDGKRLVCHWLRNQMDVYVGELEAGGKRLGEPRRLTLDDRNDGMPYWAPDSRSVLFHSNRQGGSDLFRQEIGQSAAELIQGGPEDDSQPCLSPDGRFVLYFRRTRPSERFMLMRAPVSGGLAEIVLTDDGRASLRCTPSAAKCVLSVYRENQLMFYALDPLHGKGEKLGRLASDGSRQWFPWGVSADGLCAAIGLRDEPGEILILSLTDGATRNLHARIPVVPQHLTWSAKDDGLFVTGYAGSLNTNPCRLWYVDLQGQADLLWQPLNRGEWVGHPAASPNGRRLAFSVTTSEGNAAMIEAF